MGMFRRDTSVRTYDDPRSPGTVRGLTASGGNVLVGHRAKAAAYNSVRPITAAAQQVTPKTASTARRSGQTGWQAEAWTGYDRVGEIHYAFNMVANIMSRVRIYAACVVDAADVPVDVDQAAKDGKLSHDVAVQANQAIREIAADGFAEMIRAFTLNMAVAGECYLVQLPSDLGDLASDKVWGIRSTDDVTPGAAGPSVTDAKGTKVVLPPETYVARVWRQHPRHVSEPDSSMVGVADDIELLLMLQRLIRGAIRSRLSAGLVYIPDTMVVLPSTTESSSVIPDPLDPQPEQSLGAADPGGAFMSQFVQQMTTPLGDEGSAATVVPMLVTGPGGDGDKIKHITFERTSDEWLANRSDRALERILQGLDVPKEMVTGLANVRYSNATVIDENLYRTNIEPLCLVLVDMLLQVYLRPVLKAAGIQDEDLDRLAVWYDPSEIVTRPNSSTDADTGYDKGLLSAKAWRREHGFAESDAPEEADIARKLVLAGATPEAIMQTLLQTVLPELLGKAREENAATTDTPMPESASNLLNLPTRPRPPEPTTSQDVSTEPTEIAPNGRPAPVVTAL